MQHRRRPVHLAQAVLIAALVWLGAAHAREAPVPGLQPAGEGRLRWFGFDVYDAALWVAPGFRAREFERHAFVLELAYLREIQGTATAQRSIELMRRIEPIDRAQAQRWFDALRAVLPNVKPGDRIAGVNRPGQGVEFLFNGRPVGAIADPAFAARFFAIWLSTATPEPALRARLLEGTAP